MKGFTNNPLGILPKVLYTWALYLITCLLSVVFDIDALTQLLSRTISVGAKIHSTNDTTRKSKMVRY